ncbi:MAG: 23S rRNA (adenine(2503)-C(2))-methyltransferase [Candidatus Aminicenantes bacterium RBG_19FT_COMBO_58_17]|nr:MAG: 23S rRNA (adenine(2503)-C(2))-methyltransferase [Candidatus Aminicenantes bacterium RBG_19FT_COMBO_58_17]
MGPVADIRNLTFAELRAEFDSWGEPAYRAKQVFEWIYQKGADSFAAMTDLPKSLRQRLEDKFRLGVLELAEQLRSEDGTEKLLFRLTDGQLIEAVLIPSGGRRTLCLSTQVGCKFACVFCASGAGGFARNLLPSEMLGQILFLRDKLDVGLTNFVFMGMGEPLDNLDNLVRTVRIMNAPEGMGIAARRMTISTVGIVPAIEKLEGLGLQVSLSLSLHATTDELRSRLLPVNRKYPLAEVVKAGAHYARTTGRMITIEYILISSLNDSAADARRLASIARKLRAKINLIPYSQGCGAGFAPSPGSRQQAFLQTLESLGVAATVRRSKGGDIRAACGQLAGKKRGTCF